MTAEEYDHYLPHLIEGYAMELSKYLDMSQDAARERATEQTAGFLTQGVETPNNLLFTVRNEPTMESTGYLWVFVDEPQHKAFIYDIEIAEAFRGKGLGRAVLLALEDLLRPLGIEKVELHVFGNNRVAIHLYESLGYQPFSINMRKRL
jgi:ribosomal protein S18 acetylase RimI-like enzyme